MSKPLGIFSLLIVLLMSAWACQPSGSGSGKLDPETEKLQREVDSLRRVKEALQDELADTKGEDTPLPKAPEPETSSNAADGPLDGLTVLSAKNNLTPILIPSCASPCAITPAKKLPRPPWPLILASIAMNFRPTAISKKN